MAIKFQENSKLVKDKLRETIKNEMNMTLARVMSSVVPLTPVGKSKRGYTGGRLRKGWSIIPVRERNGVFTGFLTNNVHYVSHVNYGHRTRLRTGRAEKYKPKKNGLAFVKGRHFIEKALQENGLKFKKRGL